MDSLTQFHSKKCILLYTLQLAYSLNVMALSVFQNFWVDTSLNSKTIQVLFLKTPLNDIPLTQ